MKTKFSKTDLGCVIGDNWDIFGNRIRVSDDGLHLTGNGEPENPVLPFPFTLEQFRAFCERRPTFLWEEIESVFTNDDGSLDDGAIERLNPASSAADLVRAILAGPDSEFLEAWKVWEKVDECKAEIEEMQRARKNAKTPTEVIAAKQELERLHDDLATLLTQATGATPVPPQQPEPHRTEQEAPAPASVEQVEPVQAAEADRSDLAMLATPDELIEAFGRFTGMSKAWFSNITDKPGLEQARRIKGVKGKGGHKPLFCPLAVMQWLTDEKRKVGRSISEEKGWKLLESYFPRVHAAHAAADPR